MLCSTLMITDNPSTTIVSTSSPKSWLPEKVQTNFLLVRKVLRRLGLKLKLEVDQFQSDGYSQGGYECSFVVENFFPDYFVAKVKRNAENVAVNDAMREFCRIMEFNCLISHAMYDAWYFASQMNQNHPHLFDRIAAKVKENHQFLLANIPCHVNPCYLQTNFKRAVDRAFDLLYEKLRKNPDAVSDYLDDFGNSYIPPTKNEFGIIPQSSKFETMISHLRNSRTLFPQHFQQFEQDAKAYVESREEREFEKLLKQEAVKVLMGTIKDNPHFSKGKFVIVGSTINGTAATKSDLDLHFCMNVPNDRMPSLKQLCEHLKRQRCVTSVYPIFLTTVPIVQVVLNPPYDLLRIEISIDSCHAVHTTHLVRHYMKMDYRARYLAFLVKEWAVNQNIRTPSNGTMSGISLVIMVIHFLQCCCNPPILPNLQFTRQDLFSNNIPTERLVEIEDASSLLPCQMPSNDATLGELFIAFFEYYSNFGFDQNGISLEHGGIISRDELSVETDRRGMYVDEPFAHFNTLRSLVDYDLVLQSIKDAFHLLNGHKLNEAAPDFKILMHQKNSL